MYVLDEPRLAYTLVITNVVEYIISPRDLGNSVLVVEHDEDAIRQADWLADVGPLAGKQGGHIVACTPKMLLKHPSLTADYLNGRQKLWYRHHVNLWIQINVALFRCYCQ